MDRKYNPYINMFAHKDDRSHHTGFRHDLMGWCAQIPEVRYPDIILVLQAQELDDAHDDAAKHHISFRSLEGFYDTLLLTAVLYLWGRVSVAFPAVMVQPGDRMCPEMVTEAPSCCFISRNMASILKRQAYTSMISPADMDRSVHARMACVSTYSTRTNSRGWYSPCTHRYVLERKRTSLMAP